MINSFNFDWKFYLGHYKDLTRPVIFNNKTSTFKHWARMVNMKKKFLNMRKKEVKNYGILIGKSMLMNILIY